MQILKLLLVFLFVPFVGQAQVLRAKPLAMIYSGPGACQGCPESVGILLQKMGFEIGYVQPGQLTPQNFAKTSLYVQPGGDRSSDVLRALSVTEVQNLRQFIGNGGKYLGICAGAFLAAQWSRSGKRPAFALVPWLWIMEESPNRKPMLMSVNWMGQGRMIYHQGGPHFGPEPFPGAEVVARYTQTNRIAAMISPYGKGRVGLLGPHPEADEEWYREDGLDMRYGLNQDLIYDFLRRVYR